MLTHWLAVFATWPFWVQVGTAIAFFFVLMLVIIGCATLAASGGSST